MDPPANDVLRYILTLCDYPTKISYICYLNKYRGLAIDPSSTPFDGEQLMNASIEMIKFVVETVQIDSQLLTEAMFSYVSSPTDFEHLRCYYNIELNTKSIQTCIIYGNEPLFKYLHEKYDCHYYSDFVFHSNIDPYIKKINCKNGFDSTRAKTRKPPKE